MWSQGVRAMLERIPTDRLDVARQVIGNELEGLRDEQKMIRLRMRVRITTANRPGLP
jgi:hypothetical protein